MTSEAVLWAQPERDDRVQVKLRMATESTENTEKKDFTAETQRTQRRILIEKHSSTPGYFSAAKLNLSLWRF
jgi:hypothetical protein